VILLLNRERVQMLRFLAILTALAFGLGQLAPAQAAPTAVGFQHVFTPDGTEVGVWYPAEGTPVDVPMGVVKQSVVIGVPVAGDHLPLVVMSHGSGGIFAGNVDTALALVRAGFVVAALTHPGDNWQDRSRSVFIEDRPKQLSKLIDFMTAGWAGHAAIDQARIGAFGFSAGGFTVLAVAGGNPDFALIPPHCAANPKVYECQLVAEHPRSRPAPWTSQADPRVRAAVIAAPALGYAFKGGLGDVRIPIQLWRADNDHTLPVPDYADAVRAALPVPPEFHTVPGAEHIDFLAPCNGPLHLPQVCDSDPGFDRAAFHQTFDADVVRFFESNLTAK
jgi:predicted dienelactone hydrolase